MMSSGGDAAFSPLSLSSLYHLCLLADDGFLLSMQHALFCSPSFLLNASMIITLAGNIPMGYPDGSGEGRKPPLLRVVQ